MTLRTVSNDNWSWQRGWRAIGFWLVILVSASGGFFVGLITPTLVGTLIDSYCKGGIIDNISSPDGKAELTVYWKRCTALGPGVTYWYLRNHGEPLRMARVNTMGLQYSEPTGTILAIAEAGYGKDEFAYSWGEGKSLTIFVPGYVINRNLLSFVVARSEGWTIDVKSR